MPGLPGMPAAPWRLARHCTHGRAKKGQHLEASTGFLARLIAKTELPFGRTEFLRITRYSRLADLESRVAGSSAWVRRAAPHRTDHG